jgi:glycosyltransferase involved in cell wall biosynthesis
VSAFADRLHGLRWRLRAARRLFRGGAVPTESFLPPIPQEPEPMGKIDVPGPGAEIAGPIFIVRGWALFPHSPTTKVDIQVNGEVVGRARLAHLRPDVVENWNVPQAISAGFELAIEREVVELPKGPATVAAVASSVSGEWQVVGPVEVVIADPKGEDLAPGGAKEELSPPPSPTPVVAPKAGPRVLVVTHQLSLGGAQLYLLDLLRQLVKTHGGSFTVISALDGPVQRDLEEIGVPVHIFGFPPADLSSYLGRLEEMATWSRGREFDVALLNTATIFTLPGADLAQLLGIPYVWAIHESFHPSVLWSVIPPRMRERAEAAVAGAEALVFEADATRRLFEADAGGARCLTLPYGLDIEPIDAWRASFDNVEEREKAGIPADAELVVCIGTIEPRKAQNTLAQAFDLIAAKHPRAHLAFVGGREDPDCEALEKLIEARGANGKRMHVIPITPDVHAWYGMADLLVCASDVESLPRTVLEAMAWETPVLATNVFGIPELIDDGETGWLCEPRDLEALAQGLDRALSSSAEERAAVARAARALVTERHSSERYGRQIGELLGLTKGADDAAT